MNAIHFHILCRDGSRMRAQLEMNTRPKAQRERTSKTLKLGANESQKTRNKKHQTKRFSTFAVYRLRHSETQQKKNIA